ncbi:hypothetical protein BH11PSE5_BH11PSE5_20330 [soil metagenome]
MANITTAARVQQIAATLIVRNEARCIVRCLESVRPWVDRIVVLDTGSTDETMNLAKSCGADVHRIEWPDDFSIARNHVLDIADADWNLVIDADEWIVTGGDKLREWCAGNPQLGAVCIHSQFEMPGGGNSDVAPSSSRSWITRLLPRGARFQGRIHEQVQSPLPRRRLELHLEHDGYLTAQMANKQERNRELLLLDLKENPDDPYTLYQLGKEAEIRDDFLQASNYYTRSMTRTPQDANWRHELIIRALHCLGKSGKVDQALDIADAQMPLWQESPDFFFVFGNLALEKAMNDLDRAMDHWLPLSQWSWQRCLDIGERPDLEGSVHGRGSFLAQHNLDLFNSQMGLAAEG